LTTDRRTFLTAGAATLVLAALWPRRARADAPVPAKLTAADVADVTRVENYLNQITTMRSSFAQADSNGGLASGTIYIARPGRMRVEYNPPARNLMIASGGALVYYDPELDQLTTLPLSSTPAYFLLRSAVKLTDGLTITGFSRGPGILRIRIVENDSADAGSVELVLADKPLSLRQWIVTDAQGIKTQVTLNDAAFGVALDNALFAIPEGPASKLKPKTK
jgi:outer membrane lipoprotein-sorting protein